MGVRQQHDRDMRKAKNYTNKYSKELKRLRAAEMKKVINNMRGDLSQLGEIAAGYVNEDYLPSFYKRVYANVGVDFAQEQYLNITGEDLATFNKSKDIYQGIWNYQLQNYVDNELGERIVSVQGTLKKWVQATVTQFVDEAILDGTSIEKLIQEARKYLQNQYTGYQEWKVRQIVSNEVLQAYSVSNKIGADSSGIPYTKTWLHSRSKHPHLSHVALNNTTIGQNDKFDVGGYPAKYPRDVSLPASQSVNCLCTVIYRPK